MQAVKTLVVPQITHFRYYTWAGCVLVRYIFPRRPEVVFFLTITSLSSTRISKSKLQIKWKDSKEHNLSCGNQTDTTVLQIASMLASQLAGVNFRFAKH